MCFNAKHLSRFTELHLQLSIILQLAISSYFSYSSYGTGLYHEKGLHSKSETQRFPVCEVTPRSVFARSETRDLIRTSTPRQLPELAEPQRADQLDPLP